MAASIIPGSLRSLWSVCESYFSGTSVYMRFAMRSVLTVTSGNAPALRTCTAMSSSSSMFSGPLLMRTTSPSFTFALWVTRRSASFSKSVGGAFIVGFAASEVRGCGATCAGGCGEQAAASVEAAAQARRASNLFMSFDSFSGKVFFNRRGRRPYGRAPVSNSCVRCLGFTYEEAPARGLLCVRRTSSPNRRGRQLFRTRVRGRVIIARVRARLYERLLGEAWGELDAPVRRLHERGSGPCGEGLFVVRGGNLFARALARMFRLPAGGEGVRVCLSVTHAGDGAAERWQRTFGGRAFDTRQREGEGGLLAERAGPLELLFELSVEGGALVYAPAGAALR